MNASRNITHESVVVGLGVEPLDTRSIILSALLGSHPPSLPAHALVALAELFGIRAGTTRTALSRLVARGELLTADGRYTLTGRLLDRQRQQDAGRVAPTPTWDGSWYTAVAVASARSMAERRRFRESLSAARFGELRPDIWMRPANIALDTEPAGVLTTHGALRSDDVTGLVTRLWPLDEIEAQAQRLHTALTRQQAVIAAADIAALPTTFTVAAATVRFLRSEPQLPAALAPATWTPPSIRPLYDEMSVAFRGELRRFFASIGAAASADSPR